MEECLDKFIDDFMVRGIISIMVGNFFSLWEGHHQASMPHNLVVKAISL